MCLNDPCLCFLAIYLFSSHRTLEALEKQDVEETPHLQKKAKQAGFLQTKAREYRRQLQQLQV